MHLLYQRFYSFLSPINPSTLACPRHRFAYCDGFLLSISPPSLTISIFVHIRTPAHLVTLQELPACLRLSHQYQHPQRRPTGLPPKDSLRMRFRVMTSFPSRPLGTDMSPPVSQTSDCPRFTRNPRLSPRLLNRAPPLAPAHAFS